MKVTLALVVFYFICACHGVTFEDFESQGLQTEVSADLSLSEFLERTGGRLYDSQMATPFVPGSNRIELEHASLWGEGLLPQKNENRTESIHRWLTGRKIVVKKERADIVCGELKIEWTGVVGQLGLKGEATLSADKKSVTFTGHLVLGAEISVKISAFMVYASGSTSFTLGFKKPVSSIWDALKKSSRYVVHHIIKKNKATSNKNLSELISIHEKIQHHRANMASKSVDKKDLHEGELDTIEELVDNEGPGLKEEVMGREKPLNAISLFNLLHGQFLIKVRNSLHDWAISGSLGAPSHRHYFGVPSVISTMFYGENGGDDFESVKKAHAEAWEKSVWDGWTKDISDKYFSLVHNAFRTTYFAGEAWADHKNIFHQWDTMQCETLTEDHFLLSVLCSLTKYGLLLPEEEHYGNWTYGYNAKNSKKMLRHLYPALFPWADKQSHMEADGDIELSSTKDEFISFVKTFLMMPLGTEQQAEQVDDYLNKPKKQPDSHSYYEGRCARTRETASERVCDTVQKYMCNKDSDCGVFQKCHKNWPSCGIAAAATWKDKMIEKHSEQKYITTTSMNQRILSKTISGIFVTLWNPDMSSLIDQMDDTSSYKIGALTPLKAGTRWRCRRPDWFQKKYLKWLNQPYKTCDAAYFCPAAGVKNDKKGDESRCPKDWKCVDVTQEDQQAKCYDDTDSPFKISLTGTIGITLGLGEASTSVCGVTGGSFVWTATTAGSWTWAERTFQKDDPYLAAKGKQDSCHEMMSAEEVAARKHISGADKERQDQCWMVDYTGHSTTLWTQFKFTMDSYRVSVDFSWSPTSGQTTFTLVFGFPTLFAIDEAVEDPVAMGATLYGMQLVAEGLQNLITEWEPHWPRNKLEAMVKGTIAKVGAFLSLEDGVMPWHKDSKTVDAIKSLTKSAVKMGVIAGVKAATDALGVSLSISAMSILLSFSITGKRPNVRDPDYWGVRHMNPWAGYTWEPSASMTVYNTGALSLAPGGDTGVMFKYQQAIKYSPQIQKTTLGSSPRIVCDNDAYKRYMPDNRQRNFNPRNFDQAKEYCEDLCEANNKIMGEGYCAFIQVVETDVPSTVDPNQDLLAPSQLAPYRCEIYDLEHCQKKLDLPSNKNFIELGSTASAGHKRHNKARIAHRHASGMKYAGEYDKKSNLYERKVEFETHENQECQVVAHETGGSRYVWHIKHVKNDDGEDVDVGMGEDSAVHDKFQPKNHEEAIETCRKLCSTEEWCVSAELKHSISPAEDRFRCALFRDEVCDEDGDGLKEFKDNGSGAAEGKSQTRTMLQKVTNYHKHGDQMVCEDHGEEVYFNGGQAVYYPTSGKEAANMCSTFCDNEDDQCIGWDLKLRNTCELYSVCEGIEWDKHLERIKEREALKEAEKQQKQEKRADKLDQLLEPVDVTAERNELLLEHVDDDVAEPESDFHSGDVNPSEVVEPDSQEHADIPLEDFEDDGDDDVSGEAPKLSKKKRLLKKVKSF